MTRTREALSSLITGRLSWRDGRWELVRRAIRLILEETLNAETRDAPRRDCCERGAEESRACGNGRLMCGGGDRGPGAAGRLAG